MPVIPVTPNHDPTIEAIAIALHDSVLAKWPDAIAGVSVVDYLPSDPSAFPHLVVHRSGAMGQDLEQCRGIVRYLILTPGDRREMPGRFRAMQLKIIQTLRGLEDPNFKWVVTQDQQFRCSEKLLGIQGGLIPFFEISFDFVDVTPLG